MHSQTMESLQASGEGWDIIGASVIGTNHLTYGKPCQDAQHFQLLPGGCLIAIISDGAGSAGMSELGSALAVKTFASIVAESLTSCTPTSDEAWSALMRSGFESAAAALGQTAIEKNVPVSELSATLLAAVIHPTRSVVTSLGDCCAVYRNSEGGWLLPIKPIRGEYANETKFLTSSNWQQVLQIKFLDAPPDRLALFSDGLMRLALNVAALAPHVPFFESVFAYHSSQMSTAVAANALRNFLQSERVNARTDDDKTLLLAWRPTPNLSELGR